MKYCIIHWLGLSTCLNVCRLTIMHNLWGKTLIQISINDDFLTGTTPLCWYCQRPFQRVVSWCTKRTATQPILCSQCYSMVHAALTSFKSCFLLSQLLVQCRFNALQKSLCRTLYLLCWPACIWCQVSFYCGSDCLSFPALLTDPCFILPAPSPHSISSCKGSQEPPLTPHLYPWLPLVYIVTAWCLSTLTL